ncbi:MAG: helix-turn-helix domain-containing protein [Archangium sp.]
MRRIYTPVAKPQRDDRHVGPVFVSIRSGTHQPRRHAVTHHYAALGFCVRGRTKLELGRGWSLQAGDVFIVPAGTPHRTLDFEAHELWGVGFCVPCFAGEVPELVLPFERVRAGAAPVVRVPKARWPFLLSLVRELSNTTAAQTSVQRSLLTLIVAELDRASASSARGSNVVADALRYIEANCLKPLTLKDIARAVRKSPSYVTRRLSAETGRSAVEWIISNRLAEARRLLLHSDESVEVIAERVGYADPTHFIRLFRREHDVTPAVWRRTNHADFRAKAALG